MAKIEELTELLVSEINNFEKGITKLEALSKKINATKISMDLTEYKSTLLETHYILQSLMLRVKTNGNPLSVD